MKADDFVSPDSVASLVKMLSNGKPIEDIYDIGDMLMHNGELGEVVSANANSLVLKMEDTGLARIVKRRDHTLKVAPIEFWKGR